MYRTACSWLFEIRVRDWTRRVSIASSTRSTRPSLAAWAWDYRSAVRSSKSTGDVYGRRQTYPKVRAFISASLPMERPRRDLTPAALQGLIEKVGHEKRCGSFL